MFNKNCRPMQTMQTERVELHLHTKFSAMDGLCDVDEAVRLAAEMGHAALAVTDYGVVQAFPQAMRALQKARESLPNFKIIYGSEVIFMPDSTGPFALNESEAPASFRMTLLAKTQEGLKNLYRIITESHCAGQEKSHCVPQALLERYREGLLLGSGCPKGALQQALAGGCSWARLRLLAQYYDYIELQPVLGVELYRRFLEMGRELHIPVVAVGNVHYLRASDAQGYAILRHIQGDAGAEEQPTLFLRTTEEMLEEFAFLGEQGAFDVVVRMPNQIAGLIDPDIQPIPQGKPLLPHIENSEISLRDTVWERARQMYGEPLASSVQARLQQELDGIFAAGHAAFFVAAQKLVEKSRQTGYPVISRGFVGASAVAFFAGITDINPLPPHYLCRSCHYTDFEPERSAADGLDLPPRNCPCCGEALSGDGHNIPFETFLGLDAQKLPDIDLNFSSEYQERAHRHAQEIFGNEKVFYAGTVSVIPEGTARQHVQRYFAEHDDPAREDDEKTGALVRLLSGVKRTSGLFPGGLFILPRGGDVHDYTPVQFQENSIGMHSTHLAFHDLQNVLPRLDLFGHDIPSVLYYLEKLTGIATADVPTNDAQVYSLLTSPAALGVTAQELGCETGTLGVPELDGSLIRHMLRQTQASGFGDLVKLAGLTHGAMTWLSHADSLLRSGRCTLSDVIATRDDVFLHLQNKGIGRERAFAIMEQVHKGHAARSGFGPGTESMLREHGMPDWYIDGCQIICYLVPKAHVVSYLIASVRLMWYKLYHPLAFYAAVFSVQGNRMDYDAALEGKETVRLSIRQLEGNEDRTYRENKLLDILRLVNEYFCRGFAFLPAELGKSFATVYEVSDGKLRLPYLAIGGVGMHAARQLEKKARPKVSYASLEDLRRQVGLSRLTIDALDEAGLLSGVGE